MASRLAKRLAKRIEETVGIVVVPKIHRTRAGRNQRAAGAWSWDMQTKTHRAVGSAYPANEIARARYISYLNMEWNDVELFPEDHDAR